MSAEQPAKRRRLPSLDSVRIIGIFLLLLYPVSLSPVYGLNFDRHLHHSVDDFYYPVFYVCSYFESTRNLQEWSINIWSDTPVRIHWGAFSH